MTQKEYKSLLIQHIHVSQRYKNYYRENRDEWKELLLKHFGVASSKELSIDNLKLLRDYCNFKRDDLPIFKGCISVQHAGFIKKIWEEKSLKKDEKSLFAFVSKIVKKDLKRLRELTSKEAGQVIYAIKNMPKVAICVGDLAPNMGKRKIANNV